MTNPPTPYFRVKACGICMHDNKILLIHRINLAREDGVKEYYVIPGGGVEEGEKVEDTVVREMKEETDVTVTVDTLFYELEDYNQKGGLEKYYGYLCRYVSGEAKLREDSEEAQEMKEGVHFYKPVWVDLTEIKNITLYPTPLKDKLIKDLHL
jgi:8-oxo-dGTP diphosphatase